MLDVTFLVGCHCELCNSMLAVNAGVDEDAFYIPSSCGVYLILTISARGDASLGMVWMVQAEVELELKYYYYSI